MATVSTSALDLRLSSRRCAVVSETTISELGEREMQGTLTSRIRSLTCDIAEGLTQHEWRAKVMQHPAYSVIHQELALAKRAGRLDNLMDQMEAIGCVVTYDRNKAILGVGLNANDLCKGFKERLAMTDLRNKRLIDHANGVSPFDRVKGNRISPEGDIQMGPTYFLTFDLS